MSKITFSKFILALIAITSIGVSAQGDDSMLFLTEDQLKAYWMNETKVAPEYPVKSLRKGESGCVAVGFVIEPDGTTNHHRAIASYPSSNFDKSAIEAAKQFLYKPSEQNPSMEAVFTINSFTYQISSNNEEKDMQVRTALGKICTDAANKSLNTDAGETGAG